MSSGESGFRRLAALTSIVLLCARSAVATETDAACKLRLDPMLSEFLSRGDTYNDNPLFSALGECAGKSELSALLDALARPVATRNPVEVASAVEAAIRSPELAGDGAATQMVVDRLGAVRDRSARESLSYLLGPRDATQALERVLAGDPAPEVRAAAAVSLRNCKTQPDFAALWRAAKGDPEVRVRAQSYQTLDRYGQLRSAEDFLDASRPQTDAASAGRLIGLWLKATKASAEETAETLTRLAEHSGSIEASGALSEIFIALQSSPRALVMMSTRPDARTTGAGPSVPATIAPIESRAMANAASQVNPLRRPLFTRRERITRAALAQFAASESMQEDAARIAIDCALTINNAERAGASVSGRSCAQPIGCLRSWRSRLPMTSRPRSAPCTSPGDIVSTGSASSSHSLARWP